VCQKTGVKNLLKAVSEKEKSCPDSFGSQKETVANLEAKITWQRCCWEKSSQGRQRGAKGRKRKTASETMP